MGTRTEKTGPKTAALRCRANQTERKRKKTKKSAKLKIQEERKASTNLLALQEHIPKMWEHGPKKPVRKPQLCGAEQTRPKESGRKQKKSAKLKIQEERKASTNLLALQEHIPTMWEHGPKKRVRKPQLCGAEQTRPKESES